MVTEHRPPGQRRIRIPGTPEERARAVAKERGLWPLLSPGTPPEHEPETEHPAP